MGAFLASAASAQSTTPYRVKTVHYDYDNNGITDATTLYTYGPIGEITDVAYTYVGDGTPDLFVTEEGEEEQITFRKPRRVEPTPKA